MTFGRASALIAGLLAAIALAIYISPHIRNDIDQARPDATAASPSAPATDAAPSTPSTPSEYSAPVTPAAPKAAKAGVIVKRPGPMSFTPELEKRLRSVLNRGADLAVASEGFRDPEQFAAAAHAARNTDVPFMVLRHEMIDQGKSLTAAIHALKPELNAQTETKLARDEAKADLSAAQSQFASAVQ